MKEIEEEDKKDFYYSNYLNQSDLKIYLNLLGMAQAIHNCIFIRT
jgi:hypothetical protein